MRSSEIGCARVWVKDDTSAYLFHPDCYAELRAAWMRGEAFFTGHDCYGDELTVRLSAVLVVNHATPEAMALADRDAKADGLTEG